MLRCINHGVDMIHRIIAFVVASLVSACGQEPGAEQNREPEMQDQSQAEAEVVALCDPRPSTVFDRIIVKPTTMDAFTLRQIGIAAGSPVLSSSKRALGWYLIELAPMCPERDQADQEAVVARVEQLSCVVFASPERIAAPK